MQRIKYQHTERDSRMLYGIGGPLLAAVALIVAFMLMAETWMLPLLMLAVFALTGLILWGFGNMISEDENLQDRSR